MELRINPNDRYYRAIQDTISGKRLGIVAAALTQNPTYELYVKLKDLGLLEVKNKAFTAKRAETLDDKTIILYDTRNVF